MKGWKKEIFFWLPGIGALLLAFFLFNGVKHWDLGLASIYPVIIALGAFLFAGCFFTYAIINRCIGLLKKEAEKPSLSWLITVSIIVSFLIIATIIRLSWVQGTNLKPTVETAECTKECQAGKLNYQDKMDCIQQCRDRYGFEKKEKSMIKAFFLGVPKV